MSGTTTAGIATRGLSTSKWTFVRHYLEMVAVMLIGMFVLGGAVLLALEAVGVDTSSRSADAPALDLAGMGAVMTIPMVWWMRRRGHAWRPTFEMAMAMVVPTALVLVLLWTGALTDIDTLMAIEHSIMFPAMFAVMLARYDEYAQPH